MTFWMKQICRRTLRVREPRYVFPYAYDHVKFDWCEGDKSVGRSHDGCWWIIKELLESPNVEQESCWNSFDYVMTTNRTFVEHCFRKVHICLLVMPRANSHMQISKSLWESERVAEQLKYQIAKYVMLIMKRRILKIKERCSHLRKQLSEGAAKSERIKNSRK